MPAFPIPRCALLAACVLVASACAQPSPTRASAEDEAAAVTDSDAPTPANLVLPRPRGPEDMVEARSGPHVFRFPVKYDYNQAGPWGDGSWMLKFMWPTLEAMPWRRGRAEDHARDWDENARSISVSVDYVSRVPIREFPQRYADPIDAENPSPDESIAYRDRQNDQHGLEHWAVAFDRVFAEMRRRHGEPRNISAFQKDSFEDWWIARAPDGRMRTFIRCLPMELPGDGIKVVDGLWDRDMSEPLARCRHEFAIADFSSTVEIKYPREALPRWAEIEAHVEAFLRKHSLQPNARSVRP